MSSSTLKSASYAGLWLNVSYLWNYSHTIAELLKNKRFTFKMNSVLVFLSLYAKCLRYKEECDKLIHVDVFYFGWFPRHLPCLVKQSILKNVNSIAPWRVVLPNNRNNLNGIQCRTLYQCSHFRTNWIFPRITNQLLSRAQLSKCRFNAI